MRDGSRELTTHDLASILEEVGLSNRLSPYVTNRLGLRDSRFKSNLVKGSSILVLA